MAVKIEKKVRDLDKEIGEIDTRLAELNAEEAGLKVERLTWADVAENIASVQEREQRKGLIPRMIRAGEIRRRELQRKRAEAELDELQQACAADYDERQKLQDEIDKVQEEFGKAQHAWSESLRRVNRQEARIKELDREIQALEGGE